MKKSKLLVAAVTATAMALGGGALVGCNNHSHTYSEEWQKNAEGHWLVATCDDLKEGDEGYTKDYAEHVWGDDNVCDVCEYEKQTAPVVTEYTVTLNVGAGTLAGTTTLTTVNGKLATLPTPTAPEGKTFKGWYTAATDGTKVTTDYKFTGETKTVTIYAIYEDEATPPVTEHVVTLNAGEGTLSGSATLTTVDGKLAELPTPTAPTDHWFKGWYTEAAGAGELVTLDTEYTEATTIYAHYLQECTVTLEVGAHGTLAEGTATTLKTVNGKLANLPEPSVPTHFEFDAWYTQATGGAEVTAEYEFEVDATIHAQYLREDGVWLGDEFKAELTVNVGCTDHVQYWLGGGNITLSENDEVSLYLNGKIMTYTVKQNSTCITVPNASARVTSVTVNKDATFVLYLNQWGPDNWQVEYTGTPLSVETTNEIPEGCTPITITFTNGTVTLYIVAPGGTAISTENAANYQIHGWQTGNTGIFGAWNDNPTLDQALSVEEDCKDDLILMFHWQGGQSSNVSNIKVNKAFVVWLVETGECTVKEYVGTVTPDVPATPETPDVPEA